MTDDWQWFWAGEGGRDRILRDEVEGLHARLFSASAQTTRLSSQLATLSGSIESRLDALSAAFDAYVELGDVREELSAYEDSAAVRRDVMAGIDALAGGRSAAPVDSRGLDYWLPYAMNAVIHLFEGRAAEDELDQARALSVEADLFVVAACGALGRGASVIDLLPVVLTADQELTQHQRLVWRAVAAGAYGDRIDVLASAWRPQLDREPVPGWSAWVNASATRVGGIAWLHLLVTDPQSLRDRPAESREEGWPVGSLPPERSAATSESKRAPSGPAAGLRAVVTELIGRGMPAEADLLRRAATLRAWIENPRSTRKANDEPERATVVSEVRWALVEPSTSLSVRTTLQSWVAPMLLGVVDQLTAAATAAPPAQETVRGVGGVVVVTATGADPNATQAGVARLEAAYQVSNRPLIGWSIGAGIAALLAGALGIAGSGWAWLFALGLVVGVIGAIRQLRAARATQQAGAQAIARFQQSIAEATVRAETSEQQRTALLVQLTGEAADLHDRLAFPAQRLDAQP